LGAHPVRERTREQTAEGEGPKNAIAKRLISRPRLSSSAMVWMSMAAWIDGGLFTEFDGWEKGQKKWHFRKGGWSSERGLFRVSGGSDQGCS
jgi:hypothetical protein